MLCFTFIRVWQTLLSAISLLENRTVNGIIFERCLEIQDPVTERMEILIINTLELHH